MNWISTVAEKLRRRVNINATIRELHMLNDYQLKDLGIMRGQIDSVARGIIDFHRLVRDKSEEEQVENILSSPEETSEGLSGFKDIQGSRDKV